MPEVASDGALLVDPLDERDIRNAVLKLLADASLRARLVENGLANVRRFRPVVVATAYLDIYRNICRE
jgi:glycosyltransferase involved in cell wall biosynthesis